MAARLEVEITYRIPAPVMNGVVAGRILPVLRGLREPQAVERSRARVALPRRRWRCSVPAGSNSGRGGCG